VFVLDACRSGKLFGWLRRAHFYGTTDKMKKQAFSDFRAILPNDVSSGPTFLT